MDDRRRVLPLSHWPPRDRSEWQAARQGAGLFKPQSVMTTWRPRTIKAIEEAYGAALAWLQRIGSLDPDEPPARRWTVETLQGYLDDMAVRLRSSTRAQRLVGLERALCVIDPQHDRSIIQMAARALSRHAAPRDQRARLRDPAELVDLGLRLMARADAGRQRERRKAAAVYRDGLQIALLALRPLRKENFAKLRLGKHLIRVNETWWICVPAEETKTRQVIEIPFPPQLVPAFQRYLEHYRPLLAAGRYDGDRLWVTYHFSAQTPHSIQLRITAQTARAFGRSLCPHLFRDCVATSIAIHDPVNVRSATSILGHRTFATAEVHYNLATSLEASSAHADAIRKRRRRATHDD